MDNVDKVREDILNGDRGGDNPASAPAAVDLPIFHPMCKVCHHEDRKEIEDRYLRWENSMEFIMEYTGLSVHNLYRHANHSGLRDKRASNWRGAVVQLLERGLRNEKLDVKGSEILAAAKTLGVAQGDLRPDGAVTVNTVTAVMPLGEEFAKRLEDAEKLKRGQVASINIEEKVSDVDDAVEPAAAPLADDAAAATAPDGAAAAVVVNVDREDTQLGGNVDVGDDDDDLFLEPDVPVHDEPLRDAQGWRQAALPESIMDRDVLVDGCRGIGHDAEDAALQAELDAELAALDSQNVDQKTL